MLKKVLSFKRNSLRLFVDLIIDMSGCCILQNNLKTDSSHQFFDDRYLYASLPLTPDNGIPDAANAEIKLPRPHVDPGPHRKYKKRDDHYKY